MRSLPLETCKNGFCFGDLNPILCHTYMVQLETYVPGTRHFFSFLFGLGLGFKVRYGSTILPKGAGPSIPNADDCLLYTSPSPRD